MTSKMPVVFIGHGSPENAIGNNKYSSGWKKIAKMIPKPKAIVCISAHWITQGETNLNSNKENSIIYDFYGFPQELYDIKYPAKGDPKLSTKIKNMLFGFKVNLDEKRGLDHGTWSVLVNMYPNADIPVIQLSIDYSMDSRKIFEIGKVLSKLREEQVLILGSGNLVHNLRLIDWNASPYEWAIEYDNFVKKSIENGDFESLINFKDHELTSIAHPTYDHFLPLIYALGATSKDRYSFFNEEIFAGSVSMRCVVWS